MQVTTLIVLGVALSLGGCTRIQEMAMPIPDKINAAFPPSPEVIAARHRLDGALADDPAAAETLRTALAARLQARALACSQKVSIGRTDSVASVRALGLERSCFQEQDRQLERFFGLRTLGVLLAKPPLRPLRPAGAIATIPRGKLNHVSSGSVAREAGVGVLRDGMGNGAVVEIPGGTVIGSLPRLEGAGAERSTLSPNGRILAAGSHSSGVTFYDSESGAAVWHAPEAYRVTVWLPQVASAIVDSRGGAMLADLQTGTIERHPSLASDSNYATALPGPGARALAGSARELNLIDHVRGPNGVQATILKSYRVKGGGVTSGDPVPMRSGKAVVFASSRDIGWLDLESGDSGTWRSSPLFGIPFAKLDETHLMFDAIDGTVGLQPWSFDIDALTVARIDLGGQRGLIVNIGDRVGFFRRGDEAWFGDTVVAGEPQSLDKVVGEHQLKEQLAKLQAAEARAQGESETMRSGLPYGLAERASRDPVLAAMLARERALPRPDSAPGLEAVPANAEVHIVGVYEGASPPGPAGRSPVPNPKRDVRVTVRGSRPVVLVLASYDPVQWNVQAGGARIAAVLLSGYHPSTVVGVRDVPILRIGAEYAYQSGSREYERLRASVAAYAGSRPIRSFQGSYAGSDFQIAGS